MPQLPVIQNIDPYTSAQIFKKEVTFYTQDEITGQNLIEGYNVNGPFHTSITAIPLVGGTKFVVPLTSDSTGNGAPFLKFHFPNGTSSNKMYVTFAVKNSRMADGYYDYKTGIPDSYKTQLKNFIIAPQVNLATVNGPRSKQIRFTVYGSSTNKPAEAQTFYVTFKAVFSTTTTTSPTVTAPLVDLGGTTTSPSTPTGPGGISITGFPGRTLSL